MAKKFEMAGSKALAVVLAAVLILGGIVGSTMAWLMAETDDVVNTFTYGDINIGLDESVRDEDGNPVDEDGDGIPDRTTSGEEFEMIPGQEIEKDPLLTVKAESEDAWVFVKMVEAVKATVDGKEMTFGDYMTYEMDAAWTQLTDANGDPVEGVYFCKVLQNNDADTELTVIKDNKIQVLDTVTKEMLNSLEEEPTLTITGYAVQYAGFEAKDATTGEISQNPTAAELNAAALNAWNTVVMAGTTNP